MTSSTKVDFPADLILGAAGIKGVKSVASGKYRLSKVEDFGGAYWATHLVRDPRDEFGLQFNGIAGLKFAEKYRNKLMLFGFIDRDEGKQNGKATFVRSISQLADGSPDVKAIRAAKAELDLILSQGASLSNQVGTKTAPRVSFVDAFRGSLPFYVDLELPPRIAEPMREIDL
jgi:hypothetical protein